MRRWIGFLLALWAMSFAPSALADALSAAMTFRDSATGVYQQGVDVCGGDCETELYVSVSNLGGTLGPLNAAIAIGNLQQIRDAVTNTVTTLGAVCTALRVDCPPPPLGPSEPVSKSGQEIPAAFSCSELCAREQGACVRGATLERYNCVNRIDEFVGCRRQAPFCDWRGSPFDAAAYNNCRTTAYYRQFLPECRCALPPGQSERQGGCPDFFAQAIGQVGTGLCEVPDGLGCARCCHAKCVGGDLRLSCRGINREECDVCEWTRRTLVAGTSMRSSLCEATNFRREDACDSNYQACLQGCTYFGPSARGF